MVGKVTVVEAPPGVKENTEPESQLPRRRNRCSPEVEMVPGRASQ